MITIPYAKLYFMKILQEKCDSSVVRGGEGTSFYVPAQIRLIWRIFRQLLYCYLYWGVLLFFARFLNSWCGNHRRGSIKKAILENFAICTEKHLSLSLFLIKLQVCNFIKKRLQHKCFPVNIAEFSRTPTLKNISVRLQNLFY